MDGVRAGENQSQVRFFFFFFCLVEAERPPHALLCLFQHELPSADICFGHFAPSAEAKLSGVSTIGHHLALTATSNHLLPCNCAVPIL